MQDETILLFTLIGVSSMALILAWSQATSFGDLCVTYCNATGYPLHRNSMFSCECGRIVNGNLNFSRFLAQNNITETPFLPNYPVANNG